MGQEGWLLARCSLCPIKDLVIIGTAFRSTALQKSLRVTSARRQRSRCRRLVKQRGDRLHEACPQAHELHAPDRGDHVVVQELHHRGDDQEVECESKGPRRWQRFEVVGAKVCKALEQDGDDSGHERSHEGDVHNSDEQGLGGTVEVLLDGGEDERGDLVCDEEAYQHCQGDHQRVHPVGLDKEGDEVPIVMAHAVEGGHRGAHESHHEQGEKQLSGMACRGCAAFSGDAVEVGVLGSSGLVGNGIRQWC